MPGMDPAARLRACLDGWRLQGAGPLAGGFRSKVFACTTADGGEVVVKLTVTLAEAQAEAAALGSWAHTGAAARLLDVNLEQAALLMERVRPATPLPGGDDRLAVEVAADLLTRLHQVRPGTFRYPELKEIYLRMEDRSRADADYEQRARGDPARGSAGLERLAAARAAVTCLCASTNHAALLHGDFVGKNLLWDGAGYVAIDPIPCIGDPCSDVGFFAAGHPPATTILRRASAVAGLSNLDPHRARRWAAVWSVLQACQAWREDQSDLDACLSSGEFEQLLHQ
jgi:streptomycin 6-kinase